MSSGVDNTVNVGETPLREEWGFEVCEEYEWENVRSLRGLMQSELNDLMELQNTIKDNISLNVIRIILEKSEMNEDDYESFKEKKTATIHREDTNDEYIQFTTINLGDI